MPAEVVWISSQQQTRYGLDATRRALCAGTANGDIASPANAWQHARRRLDSAGGEQRNWCAFTLGSTGTWLPSQRGCCRLQVRIAQGRSRTHCVAVNIHQERNESIRIWCCGAAKPSLDRSDELGCDRSQRRATRQ